ncbi:2-oxo-4-hydroxy-4-carboxy-5-ureidoimidazoline decarboxylase [Orbus hercynius]|uniref:2-oxo-4-hydroxy-4-carboxy-5-ureidoimidazoline decarboxylase n=1 Tax=Orbus hercynius TaxID=593135 RepID=A0A495RJD3_9GAMM|nr:2-oxo-4-hydroxy-4-carboxy-5-ureidoimidazoline decarboxylase [Orbus hercynius]RKS87410.1 2-oxo-4-hydroxy-4-carboxy-5-ureidoimidazoline decarboxylase [Orbus hercynius]
MKLRTLYLGFFMLSSSVFSANADLSAPYRIQDINNMTDTVYIETFRPLFNDNTWIIEESSKKRPFMGFEDMLQAILNVIKATDQQTQIKLITGHPDLACKSMRAAGIAATSQSEQTKSGLNECTEEEASRLQLLNQQYKDKFGFPFLLAVKGYNKDDIFVEMQQRITNDPDTEFNIAMQQYYKVRLLRMLDLVK